MSANTNTKFLDFDERMFIDNEGQVVIVDDCMRSQRTFESLRCLPEENMNLTRKLVLRFVFPRPQNHEGEEEFLRDNILKCLRNTGNEKYIQMVTDCVFEYKM